MLQHARAGHVAILGHVAHQQHRNAGGFRQGGQRGRYRARLRHAARYALHAHGVHGLHRIDDDEARLELIHVAKDRIQVGLGRQVQRFLERPGAFGAGPDLAGGFLGRRIEHGTAELGPPRGYFQQQRGFAHARLAGHEHHRAGHDAGS